MMQQPMYVMPPPPTGYFFSAAAPTSTPWMQPPPPMTQHAMMMPTRPSSVAAYVPAGQPSAPAAGFYYFVSPHAHGAAPNGTSYAAAQPPPPSALVGKPIAAHPIPWGAVALRQTKHVPGPGAYNPMYPQRISFNARLAPNSDLPGYGKFEAPPLPARKFMRDPAHAPTSRPRPQQRMKAHERAQVAARDTSSGAALTKVGGAVGADMAAFSVSIPIA